MSEDLATAITIQEVICDTNGWGLTTTALCLRWKKVKQKARKEKKQLFTTPQTYTGLSKLLATYAHLT
jgi:hypothetical protein